MAHRWCHLHSSSTIYSDSEDSPKACVCFVRDLIRMPIRMYSTKMTVIGIMKKTHVDTSQMGKPFWPLSNIPQNADSGMSSLPAKGGIETIYSGSPLKHKLSSSLSFWYYAIPTLRSAWALLCSFIIIVGHQGFRNWNKYALAEKPPQSRQNRAHTHPVGISRSKSWCGRQRVGRWGSWCTRGQRLSEWHAWNHSSCTDARDDKWPGTVP